MSTTHDHPHDHETSAALSNRVKRLVTALESRGILTEAELDAFVERHLLDAQPANGFRIVARAWLDAGFKARLLADAPAALAELGYDLAAWAPVTLRVVENTDAVHNVIVCTLCSCYPTSLLGIAPAWYKSEAYRSRVVRDPRGVLAEFGLALPETTAVRIWDSTSEIRYLVLPRRPSGTETLDEEALAALVTRNGLIGTAAI